MQRIYIEVMGNSVELPFGETLIGRDVGCTLRFNDPAVSRRHLRFIRRQDDVFVEDLGSSNGTLLNGRALGAAIRIYDGDALRVGSRDLVIRASHVHGAEPSTLILEPGPVATTLTAVSRALTSRVSAAAVSVTVNQRCPNCAAVVNDTDEECASCRFRWGGFRPTATTAVSTNPLNPLSRRRHDRHSVELRLVYASAMLEVEAMSRDLSRSGVFVCSEVLDDIGTECELMILIDGGPPVHVRGIVRRVVESEGAGAGEPVGMGVEFTRVGAAEGAWLDAIVGELPDDD